MIKSLCVFCGSGRGHDPRYSQAAARLGGLLAERGVTLIYGGGNIGLMGDLAEAALAKGGKVVGVIPEHLVRWEVAHLGLSELIVVDSMHSRKARMFELSDAVAVLPGGMGTLDETFEFLTWRQLKLHDKPVVVANEGGYWNPLLALIDAMVAEGFARDEHRRLITVVERVDEVIDAASRALHPKLVPHPERF